MNSARALQYTKEVAAPDTGETSEEARRVLPEQYSRADAVINVQNSMLLLAGLLERAGLRVRLPLAALTVVVAIPVGLVLRAFVGTSYAVLAIALLAVFAAVIAGFQS